MNPNAQPPAVFGDLENSIRLLTERIDRMMARDPEAEFGQSESNVGAQYDVSSYSKSDLQSAAVTLAAPFVNVEFATSLYPKKLRVLHYGYNVVTDFQAVTTGGTQLAILLEFFKDYRGPGMGDKPDSQIVLRYGFQFLQTVMNVTTGVCGGLIYWTLDQEVPLKYRYVRASLWDARARTKLTANLNTYAMANLSTSFYAHFLGD